MPALLALLGVFPIGLSNGAFFTVNNLLKVPPYVTIGLIDAGS
jgi:hypothetical protein